MMKASSCSVQLFIFDRIEDLIKVDYGVPNRISYGWDCGLK
jgi:hypothetical protein